MKLKKIFKILIIVTFIIIILDQVSKALVSNLVKGDIAVVPEVITITKLTNEGFAFGLNKQNLGNIGLCLIIIVIVFNYIIAQKDRMTASTITYLGFILAGGISNLIDRIFRGGVFDFLKIVGFPVFNFADMFIVIGWLLFLINFLKETAIDIKAAVPAKKDKSSSKEKVKKDKED